MPKFALLGLDKVIITDSLSSSNKSSTISVIEITPAISPASIVSVPSDKVKSVPEPVAVPVTV